MGESLKLFESSLKEYLINVFADAHNTAQSNLFKYNNLKLK